MALKTIQKVKSQPKQESVEAEAEVSLVDMTDEQLADYYGDLKKEVDELMANPIHQKFKKVSAFLQDRLNEVLEPTDEAEMDGDRWSLGISTCSKNNRKLKSDGVAKIQGYLGPKAFADIAKVTIGDCEKYLTPTQAEQVIDSDVGYSTKRSIKVKPLK